MEGRRRNLNLQGLLRFALDQGQEQNASDSELQEMDEEKRDFIDCALKSMTVDVIQEFEKAIIILEDSNSTPANKLGALSTIREYIDDIDFANSFVKVGGSKILLSHIKTDDNQICVTAMYIIAEMSQNNPFCQKHFVDANTLTQLLSHFGGAEEVSSSAIHATSALIQNYEPGFLEFLRIGGIKHLISCLNTSYSRVFVKTCFLIGSISSQHTAVRDELVKKLAGVTLVQMLESVTGFDIKTEIALFALSELSSSSEWNLEPGLKTTMEDTLNDLIAKNKDLPQCNEMVDYAKTILNNFNKSK